MIEHIKLVTKFAKTISSSAGSNPQELGIYTPYTRVGYRVISESASIENLKAISYIKSFTAPDFPVFELGTSESQRFFATLNIEWGSERCHMNLLFKIDNDYHKVVMQSLLNPSPYPFREFDLGSFALGSNSNLYVQIEDVGYGLLKPSDSVVFHGELVREVTIEKLIDTSIKIVNSISTIPAIIVNSNPDRKGLTFFNSSDVNIYIDTVSTVSSSSYMIKLEPDDYYESPAPIYTGNYYAVSQSGSTAIDIREYV